MKKILPIQILVLSILSPNFLEEFAAVRPTSHVLELSELQEAAELLHQAIWSAANSSPK